ncbi:hypothetical protein FBU59_002268 [Linderina macrospora]|uniref:Uncharacterized protein n=1 Tax=Linderina macrospora TaxID=4868 RepID=A0ACC1JBX2_9FUNG|nr:hypothetical protein FBU59_002268 [Linderina macrospora]
MDIVNSSDSWPQRRSPFPLTPPMPGSPRRQRKPLPSLTPSFYSEAADGWEADTIASRSSTPTLQSRTPPHNDDEHFFQIKQQKRTINDLSRQLDSRETEIAQYLDQIQRLQADMDDTRRRAHTDRGILAKAEKQVLWHERQAKVHQDEIAQLKASAQAAAKQTERRHQRAVARIKSKLSLAEAETRELAGRIRELSVELDESRRRGERQSQELEAVEHTVGVARSATAEANAVAQHLLARLDDRKQYIGELERQVIAMRAITSPPVYNAQQSASTAMPAMVRQRSLYAEMLSVAQSQGSYAPPALTSASSESAADGDHSDTSIPDMQVATGVPNVPAAFGTVGWVAVYVHLIWSMYCRLWLRPLWHLLGAILMAVITALVLNPLQKLLPNRVFRMLAPGGKRRPKLADK